ncbi:hypothetical protein NLM24_07960 [Nocardia zapadnayensis]|uniref:hypothetical protein n=1 Tax=Nocardia rhamnosiphila TaxID=426716 RepID=UPI0022472F8C|nr:hypothetical protein [Nocardia zapadnayensis]MCX0270639.1 hypothetical protein [Nocardia zapadnayensis]
MSAWDALITTISVVAVCSAVVSAMSCVWPAEPPRSAGRPAHRARHRTSITPATVSWTCALPGTPLSVDDAHNAMRHHRAHDCLRKRAAFATLVVHGCVTPDPTRRPYRQKVLS